MQGLTFDRLRFPLKLSFAVMGALFIGFCFNLETPRWAVMTAGIVAGGMAYVAGGEPFSGALRHRGLLRIVGTFIGCLAALIIMIGTIRAPALMLLLCCVWTAVCVWLSSLIRVENSYALGLAGYTALIIVVSVGASSNGSVLLAPQFAIERCSEIVIGIVCAVIADVLFSPRSIKSYIDREIDALLIGHYKLLQLCIAHTDKEQVDSCWSDLVQRTSALDGMRNYLMMESPRWQTVNRRLKALHTQSLMLITQAAETFLIQNSHPDYLPLQYDLLFKKQINSVSDVHQQMKLLRRIIATNCTSPPVTLGSWVEAATRYLLLLKGIHTNCRISKTELPVLKGEVVIKAKSAETQHALVNGLRTFVATASGSLFWLYTGWTSGSACMVMLAVITALAMRTPNPLMMAKDFVYGMALAIPVGSVIFMLVLPATQQSLLLLMIVLGLLTFVAGVFLQRRQIGTLGAFVGTLNIIVLDNPMSFKISTFIDSALGQSIGAFFALMAILLIRDTSKDRIGRTLLNRLMYAAVSALTTNQKRRHENHLPALYQQLFMLLNLYPGDIAKFRLALNLIIGHQRLRMAEIPVNADLSAFHKQLRYTAERVITARSDNKRRYYFQRLLSEFDSYQEKLILYHSPVSVTASVKRLAEMLKQYQTTLLSV